MLFRILLCLFVLMAPLCAYSANTHGLGSEARERAAWFDDALSGYRASGCTPAVPGSGTTLATFACEGYVSDGTEQSYVTQGTSTLGPLSGGDGTYWLALHKDRSGTVGSWTRHGITHYLWIKSATLPATPSNALIFSKVTVATDITAVSNIAASASIPGCTMSSRYPTLQEAIDAATAGDVICVTGSETIAGRLTIDKALTLEGDGATLNFTTDAVDQGVYITASNVTIRGLTITGPQSTVIKSQQNGIFAEGTVGAYLSDIRLEDLTISAFGDGCIQLDFVEEFFIKNNHLFDCYQYGFAGLSVLRGVVDHNIVERIDADGVAGTNAWGIVFSKHTGVIASHPLSEYITVSNNIVQDSITWACIDTHGGVNITINNNVVRNCRIGLNITACDGTCGGGVGYGPDTVTVTGNTIWNNHGTGEVIDEADQLWGIGLTGNLASTALARAVTIAGNSIDGFGHNDGTEASIELQYCSGCTVTGNTIQNSYSHGIQVYSVVGLNISGNSILGITTAPTPTAATGTITISGLPVADETVTVNGAVWTWKAAAAAAYEVTIGADADGTADNLVSALTTNTEQDGRVDIASYVDASGVITVTHDSVGRSGDTFTLAEASTNIAVSGATLSGGAAGTAGIDMVTLGGGPANEGAVFNNALSMSGYTTVQSSAADDTIGVDYGPNYVSAGVGYDLEGSGGAPQSGAGNIYGLIRSIWTYDPPSIAAGATQTFYMPAPGISSHMAITVSPNRLLDGLDISASYNTGGYIEVQLANQGAGAIDLASTVWVANGDRIVYAR